jgi:transcriptional regulator with XRE-family HTH domain
MKETFGEKVRLLREGKQLTREEFCGDETELSIRQLARIESGKSTPNLARAQFIAQQLGVGLGELTDGKSLELPKRYKELKYLILRTPLYSEEARIKKREEQFDEISEVFYDNLPEDEQLIIDCLQAKFDVHMSDDISFGAVILEDYFDQIKKKISYNLNDLVLIDLYVLSVFEKLKQQEYDELKVFDYLINRLINQRNTLDIETLFVLNNILIHACSPYLEAKNSSKVEELLKICEQIMSKIQDFQKAPILNMLEWKLCLKLLNDENRAKNCYNKSILFANMMGDNYLALKLDEEWEKDAEKTT